MFNKRLRAQRMKSKFTQQSMADKLAISLNAYQKYEQAERTPSFDCLVKISHILEVPTDYLLERGLYAKAEQILLHWDSLLLALEDNLCADFPDIFALLKNPQLSELSRLVLLDAILEDIEFHEGERPLDVSISIKYKAF